jgi:pyridoxal phosphate enzyme (YggS family)
MIAERIQEITNSLPPNVQLIAVSKMHTPEDILEAYKAGQRDFGENKVQELCEKYEVLPKDIRWHLIGHLQTNKVKYAVPFVHFIHSVDSYKLLEVINKEAAKNNRIINCLLQVHIAKEETKFGFSPDELLDTLHESAWQSLKNIRICGLMGMATNTENEKQVEQEFLSLSKLFGQIKKEIIPDDTFCELSMGMSDDYPLAIKAGSTMIRVGSSIFGARNY